MYIKLCYNVSMEIKRVFKLEKKHPIICYLFTAWTLFKNTPMIIWAVLTGNEVNIKIETKK